MKIARLALLFLLAVPLPANETITLVPATTKQTWIAWCTEPGPAVEFNGDPVDPTTLSEIVDAYANDLGFNCFNWKPNLGNANGGNGYEPTNDNADPSSFPGGWLTGTFYPQIEATFSMGPDTIDTVAIFDDFIMPIRAKVLANDETFTLIIDIVGDRTEFQTHWLSPATDYEEEYAEFAVAMIQWITDNYSFQPDYWTIPANEPADVFYDTDSPPGEAIKMANALTARMVAAGWPTRTNHNEDVIPQESINKNAFCTDDADCDVEAGIWSYHGYDYNGVDQPSSFTTRNTIRTNAATWGGGSGVPTAMLEICCSAFVGGQDGSYDHGLQIGRDIFWNMTEADISLWMPLQVSTPCVNSTAGCPAGLGDPFAIELDTLDDWYKFPAYYGLRQYSKWIRPGMIRVDTSCAGCTAEPTTGDTVKVVVWKVDAASPDDLHVIVAMNDQGGSTATVLTFSNFPAGLWYFEGIADPDCIDIPGGSGVRNRCTPDTGYFTTSSTDWVFPMRAEAIYTISQVYMGDTYGGMETIDAVGGATGAWYVEKFGDRWMLVTPEGHPFWSIGLFAVTPTGNAVAKYGDQDIIWGPQQVRRMRWWGFNTPLSHSSNWVRPHQTNEGWPGDDTQPEKVPQFFLANVTNEAWRNIGSRATQASKELFNGADDGQGVDSAYYLDFMGPTPDPFDPYLEEWWDATILLSEMQTVGNHTWTIGIATSESDYSYGFGAGNDFATIPVGNKNVHLGAVVLITSPTQTGNTTWSVTYTDEEVYAKTAFRAFMEALYATIGDLNTAWNSNYSTFGSSPTGWGQNNGSGTIDPFGLLDENGSSPWVRDGGADWVDLTGMTAQMESDLDDFLFDHADKLFSVLEDPITTEFPNLLHVGLNVIGSWVSPPRRQILQAAGNHLDLALTQLGTPDASDQSRLDFFAEHFGDRPIASWLGIVANPDSAMTGGNPDTQFPMNTQEERGTKYDELMNIYLDAVVTATGSKPYFGVRWWAFEDSTGEDANWGLVTPTDNAYNGTDAIIASGTDQWGFDTGGESDNYGDFVSAAQLTNGQILEALFLELLAMNGNGNGNGAPATISGKVIVSGKVVIQ